jgi:HEAT repeat protein
MNKGDTIESLVADISKALELFAADKASAKQVLNQLASADPVLFFAAAIRVVAVSQPSEGSRYLVLILAKDKRLSIGLLDPQVCTLQDALAVTRAAAEAGAQLQSSFEMALNKALQGQASALKSERIVRTLDILSVTCGQNCWNSFQVELMAYPDKMVRSKAALLIGRSTRNVQWIGRRLLDRDPRVQASAVEALWGLDAEEAKPHFLQALKSTNHRVAANAALGLYLSGDAAAVRILMDMLQHADPSFRLSALWAIGQTRDERFLPVLAEHYKHAEGKQRLATIGAMSRIRRREKAAHEADPLQVHMAQAAAQADGLRRLALALSCHPARDLSGIKPTEFAVWENGTFIEDYQVRLVSSPALLMAGFVVPWFASGQDAYEKSVREGLKQCLSMKRGDDLWRIDRYSIEMNPQAAAAASHESLPYDNALITPELKAAHGCISDPSLLQRVLASDLPRERAAADPVTAFQRQCEAFSKHGGKRHVFLFLHDMSGFDLQQDAAVAALRTMAQDGGVVLHGICPDMAGKWALLRDLCLAHPEGTFTEVKLEGIVDGLVDSYANLSSRFEISYSLPASAQPGTVKLKISSACGQAEASLEVSPPPAAIEAATAPAPAQEAPAQPA